MTFTAENARQRRQVTTYLISWYVFRRHGVSPFCSVFWRRLGDDLSRERISLLPWEPSIRHKTLHFTNHLAIITDQKMHQSHKHNNRPIVWSRNQHDFPLRFIDTDNFSQHYTQTQRLTEANLIELSLTENGEGWMTSLPPLAPRMPSMSLLVHRRCLEGSALQ